MKVGPAERTKATRASEKDWDVRVDVSGALGTTEGLDGESEEGVGVPVGRVPTVCGDGMDVRF